MSDKYWEIVEYECQDGKCLMIHNIPKDSKLGALSLDHRNIGEAIVEKLNEQQATISALKDIFKDIITYSEWDSKKPYCSLRIAVDKKTYYKIRKILNE